VGQGEGGVGLLPGGVRPSFSPERRPQEGTHMAERVSLFRLSFVCGVVTSELVGHGHGILDFGLLVMLMVKPEH